MITNEQTNLRTQATLRARQAEMGLAARDAAVLLSLMSEVATGDGEVTSVSSVPVIAAQLRMTDNQVQRAVLKLRDLGLIARKQLVRRAGESALSTILPAAYAVMGIESPDGSSAPLQQMPRELSELLCGQSWDLVRAVNSAWEHSEPLPQEALAELRGANYARLEQLFNARVEQGASLACEAVEHALELEAERDQGYDRIETADGTLIVNTRHLEKWAPRPISWQFLKDVLTRMHSRNPSLVTAANLSERIAEIGYARHALGFIREKPWQDAVRLLARQMETNWNKPRNIADCWYALADSVIHRPACSAH